MGNHDVDGLAGFAIAIIFIATVAVALRFWSRAVSPKVLYGWDDWLALAALPPTIAICSLVLAVWTKALGHQSSTISQAEGEFMLKILFAGDVLFNISISLSKLSALAFYGRVFRVRSNPSKLWRYSFWVILGLAIAWPIVIIPYTVAQCTPIQKYWIPSTPGSCLGQYDNFISSAVASVVIDVLILIVPLPQIFRLQISMKKRLLVAGSFFVGYGAAFMSVGRMIATVSIGNHVVQDFSYNVIPILYWIIAECGFSILAVCLPAHFQLGKRVYQFGARSLLSSQTFAEKSRGTYKPFRYSGNDDSTTERSMSHASHAAVYGKLGARVERAGHNQADESAGSLMLESLPPPVPPKPARAGIHASAGHNIV